MSTNYLKNAVKQQTVTPQTMPIPGREADMVKNNAGGFSFVLDDMARVKRFLVLGSEGNTYYQTEQKLTRENCSAVGRAIKADGKAVVDLAVDCSDRGLSAKNDTAIFVLAMCAAAEDNETRSYALANLSKVCRIPTHLYHFVDFVKDMRGFGRGLKNSLSVWYTDQDVKQLAYHAAKYHSRDGVSGRDVLRLAHPKTNDSVRNMVFQYITNGWEGTPLGRDKAPRALSLKETFGDSVPVDEALVLLSAVERLKTADEKTVVSLMAEYNLPWEAVPTNKRSKEVYLQYLRQAPVGWLLRNLGNLSKDGVLANGSWDNNRLAVDKLTNPSILKAARIHPMNILSGWNTYKTGHGLRSDSCWNVVSDINEALEAAFYASFGVVVPANKRFMFGLDMSGSMSRQVNGDVNLSCAETAALFSMVSFRTEPMAMVMGFSTSFKNLGIQRNDSFETVKRKTNENNMGGTNCSIPMTYAIDSKIAIDTFVVVTDNETWVSGKYGHPSQALNKYRQVMGIPAKLVVMALTSTNFTIADPLSDYMLDICGLDPTVPNVLSGFARGDF